MRSRRISSPPSSSSSCLMARVRRRLRDMAFVRSLREIQGIGQGQEIPDLMHLHARHPCRAADEKLRRAKPCRKPGWGRAFPRGDDSADTQRLTRPLSILGRLERTFRFRPHVCLWKAHLRHGNHRLGQLSQSRGDQLTRSTTLTNCCANCCPVYCFEASPVDAFYLWFSICSTSCCGGEGGIRTPDGLAPMPHFECGAFNHSATSPRVVVGLVGARTR